MDFQQKHHLGSPSPRRDLHWRGHHAPLSFRHGIPDRRLFTERQQCYGCERLHSVYVSCSLSIIREAYVRTAWSCLGDEPACVLLCGTDTISDRALEVRGKDPWLEQVFV